MAAGHKTAHGKQARSAHWLVQHGAMAAMLAAAFFLDAPAAFAQAKAAAAPPPGASGSSTLSQSFQGLGVNNTDPVQFESDTLEVYDQKNMAVFSGNVVARQNDSVLRCKTLNVYYEQQKQDGTQPKQDKGQTKQDNSQQKIKKMEADQDVLVTSGDQTATGSHAVFDTATQIIVMTGDVVLTQGKNVIRGNKLTINVTQNTARMESSKRVQMLVDPQQKEGAPGAAKP